NSSCPPFSCDTAGAALSDADGLAVGELHAAMIAMSDIASRKRLMVQEFESCIAKFSFKMVLGQVRHLARRARQFKNVHARVRTVDNVDVTTVIHFDIVRLDRNFATLVGAGPDAAFVRLAG